MRFFGILVVRYIRERSILHIQYIQNNNNSVSSSVILRTLHLVRTVAPPLSLDCFPVMEVNVFISPVLVWGVVLSYPVAAESLHRCDSYSCNLRYTKLLHGESTGHQQKSTGQAEKYFAVGFS